MMVFPLLNIFLISMLCIKVFVVEVVQPYNTFFTSTSKHLSIWRKSESVDGTEVAFDISKKITIRHIIKVNFEMASTVSCD